MVEIVERRGEDASRDVAVAKFDEQLDNGGDAALCDEGYREIKALACAELSLQFGQNIGVLGCAVGQDAGDILSARLGLRIDKTLFKRAEKLGLLGDGHGTLPVPTCGVSRVTGSVPSW